jgi:hypothetical protein
VKVLCWKPLGGEAKCYSASIVQGARISLSLTISTCPSAGLLLSLGLLEAKRLKTPFSFYQLSIVALGSNTNSQLLLQVV